MLSKGRKMQIYFKIAIATLVSLIPSFAIADRLNLSTYRNGFELVRGQVLQRVAGEKLADVVFFPSQSFRLSQRSYAIGTLVNGRGMFRLQGRDNATCFVAVVKANGSTDVTMTIGSGFWEAETCIGVEAVGTVDQEPPGLVIIYRAASPNVEAIEPVVLNWNARKGHFEIDMPASQKASLAGATTVTGVRKALK
jgi:hypothetical protein